MVARHRANRKYYKTLVGSLVMLAGVVIGIVIATHSGGREGVPRASSMPWVSSPSPTSPPPSVTSRPDSASGPTSPSGPAPTTTEAVAPKTVNYIVKPGDNLTIIAAWFKINGYAPLYGWNAKAIGADPNLIKPGQILIVAVQ